MVKPTIIVLTLEKSFKVVFINFGQVLSSVYSRLQLSDKDYNHSQMEYEQYISVQCVTAMN